jgi:hypothetical protein
MISLVPFPNCRISMVGRAIAGNPENDGHLSPWQEAVGHEIIPHTHERLSQRSNDGLTRLSRHFEAGHLARLTSSHGHLV